VTVALLGLIGVLVGALLAVTLQYFLGVRNEFGAATAAARLVIAELDLLIDAVEFEDVDDGSSLETPAWDKHGAALAVVLPDKHWNPLADAYKKLAVVRNPQPSTAQARETTEAVLRGCQVRSRHLAERHHGSTSAPSARVAPRTDVGPVARR
jgi:hypothetical protein